MERMKEVLELCLEAEGELEVDELEFIWVQRIAV